MKEKDNLKNGRDVAHKNGKKNNTLTINNSHDTFMQTFTQTFKSESLQIEMDDMVW